MLLVAVFLLYVLQLSCIFSVLRLDLPDSLYSHNLFDSSTWSVSYAIRFPNFRTYGAALL